MTCICRRAFRHTALLWRFEFCRDLPLCFDFLILKLSLPQPAKIGPLPFQVPRCCLTGCRAALAAQVCPWGSQALIPGIIPCVILLQFLHHSGLSVPFVPSPLPWSWACTRASVQSAVGQIVLCVWLWEPVGSRVGSGNTDGDADISLLIWSGVPYITPDSSRGHRRS